MRPWWVALSCALLAFGASAAEPTLTVTVGGQTTAHTQSSLLASPAATTVTIPADVAYKRSMTYRAVPAASLIGGAASDATLRFSTADGFSAMVPASVLLAEGNGARAYIAIEPSDAPWPPLASGASAGPFYLVWMRPELGRIVPEEWPYQVTRIEQMSSLVQRYPAIAPASGLAADNPVNRGFKQFLRNCIVCHTMNLGGDATIGPDLNVPYNPTEYLRADALRRLIRDSQTQRAWPAAKMPPFDVTILNDRDYHDVIAYLRHMAGRKVAVPAK